MNLLRFASVDIGTNASRLLLMNVIEEQDQVHFHKASLVRVPLRLGDDVFQYQEIRKEKLANFIETMEAYKHLINAYDVAAYRACATSAMREARNGEDISYLLRKSTGFTVEVISGTEEAQILYAHHLSRVLSNHKYYLYVDVGGGSTELSLFSGKNLLHSHSFNIGTIRILRKQVTREEFSRFEAWLREHVGNRYPGLEVIGSGGNINKLFKESEIKKGNPLTENALQSTYERIKAYPLEQRMIAFGFKPDRADVILPAAELFLKILQLTNAQYVHVPKIGLADGIIRQLYADYKARQQKGPQRQ